MYAPKECVVCGDTFIPKQKTQKYCCRDCFLKANPNFGTTYSYPTKRTDKCDRKSCRFYAMLGNCCSILTFVYEDSYTCKFFKEKEKK